MKLSRLFKIRLFLFLIGLPCFHTSAQVFTISRDWKFKTGDSIEWSLPGYNDEKWADLKAGLWWAHAGYDYSGFAWYRKKIFISPEIKSAVIKSGYLKLSLGQIQDVDQTFLNGKLIGETGSFSPFDGKWGQPRNYLVKADQIEWDKENTIAVRVYGPNGNGGMHTGPYSYEPYGITLKDYVKVVDSKIQFLKTKDKDRSLFTIVFKNSGTQNYVGELFFTLTDTSNFILQSKKQSVRIWTNSDSSNKFSFYLAKPLPDIYSVSAVFTESQTNEHLSKEITVSSLGTVRLPVRAQPHVVIENKIKDVFVSTPFESQRIGGWLGLRLDINLNKRLLEVDEKEMLAGYQNRPGKQNWAGEHIGKYLDAASNAWRYTHDPRLKTQMDRILTILLNTQKKDGYLGTYTPENYWTNWDVWSHKYNLVGLLSYYRSTGYKPALDAAKRIGDLLCRTFGDNPGQMDIVTSGTHVGMASTSVLGPVIDLYRYTGDQKYLDFANYIVSSYNHPDGPSILKSLFETGRVNQVANGKAYELLSNLLGIIKLYKITGEEDLFKAVKIAWNDIVENRLYITGTASASELFRDDHCLPADEKSNMGEGCVTTTWFQLNYELFSLIGESKYYDQIERTVYNQLLGSEDPETGCVSYYTPLQGKKPYSCGISCCLSSIPRGISMIPLINFGKKSGVLAILLFEPGEVNDTLDTETGEKIPFKLHAFSSFPDSGHIKYTISISKKAVFTLAVRVPFWTTHFTVNSAGEVYAGIPGQYLTIRREWANGDELKVNFDIPVSIVSGGKNYPDKIAIQRGPFVLSLDNSLNPRFGAERIIFKLPKQNILELQSAKDKLPAQWIGKQAYSLTVATDKGLSEKLILVPFSDASQTGAKAQIWLPLINYNQ